MTDIGLNQNITVGSREFHIQTATQVEGGLVKCEIFEKGRLLFTEYHQYERRESFEDGRVDLRLRRLVDQFHHSIIDSLDNLFEISNKLFGEKIAASHEKIGLIFLYMHIFDKAEQHFLQAVDINPERRGSFIYLAKCYYFQNRFNQAYDLLVTQIQRRPAYPDMHNLMGLVLLEKRDLSGAFKHFQQAIRLNPSYVEAYWNLGETVLRRLSYNQKMGRSTQTGKNLVFLEAVLKKIEGAGRTADRHAIAQVKSALSKASPKKALAVMKEFRDQNYIRKVPPEISGYEFYLRLCYSSEEISLDVLNSYEERIRYALEKNPTYPDLWNYLALIHLMQCRFYFLEGLENFREATRINPRFEKARKNLRLVENDGREFLSLIKTIV